MEIELFDDPAQATWNSGRSVSFPDVTAQRVPRVSHWTSTPCMDSDHHLPSHTAETEDGLSRQKGTLPRRKYVAFFLHEADCGASTSACATSLATVTTWLEMHRGTVRVAAVTFPQEYGRNEWSRPNLFQRQHATSVLSYREAACPELTFSANGSTEIILFAVFSPCCQRPVRNSLVPSRAQVCGAPRHGGATSLPSGIGCAAVLLGPRLRSLSAAGNPLLRHTVRTALAAILTVVCTLCARVPPGGCDMDGSFTPYALEFTIRDCLPCLAPDPGGAMNEFLRHLVPAASCSHWAMFSTFRADGILRSC
ncbi:hypothetical protein TcG_11314 [Trypanosoma cruzi]|nr:hypothetical protein TcG_11314 [Trypanosoma cruzi]